MCTMGALAQANKPGDACDQVSCLYQDGAFGGDLASAQEPVAGTELSGAGEVAAKPGERAGQRASCGHGPGQVRVKLHGEALAAWSAALCTRSYSKIGTD